MNEKRKKIFFITALILAVVFFSSLVTLFGTRFFLNDAPLGDRQAALKRAGELPQLSNRVAKEEILSAIIETKDVSLCDNAKGVVVDGIDYFSTCVSNINFQRAQETQNPELCKYISPSFYDPSACEQGVLSGKAIAAKDPAICRSGSAESIINFCQLNYFSSLARETNNPQACQSLSGQTMESCYVGFVRDAFLSSKTVNCSILSSGNRVGCESLKRINSSNLTEERCMALERGYFKDVCFQLAEKYTLSNQ